MLVSAAGDLNWEFVKCQLYDDDKGKIGSTFSAYSSTTLDDGGKTVSAVKCTK